jgi:hypothetical protein
MPPPETWIKKIDTWSKDIATEVYPEIGFLVAFIGFEVEFFDLKEELEKGLPLERRYGILLPENQALRWYPPTIYGTPFTFE